MNSQPRLVSYWAEVELLFYIFDLWIDNKNEIKDKMCSIEKL